MRFFQNLVYVMVWVFQMPILPLLKTIVEEQARCTAKLSTVIAIYGVLLWLELGFVVAVGYEVARKFI